MPALTLSICFSNSASSQQKTARSFYGLAVRFFQRVRFADNLKHQTIRSGGDGEYGEVLQFDKT
jgi:hypothetical protein